MLLQFVLSASIASSFAADVSTSTIDSNAIWEPTSSIYAALRAECVGSSDRSKCLLSFLKHAGASEQTIQFSQRIGGIGYLKKLDQHESVALARVRALGEKNAYDVLYFVNGSPSLIAVSSSSLLDPLQNDPRLAELKQTQQQARLWADNADSPGFKITPSGEERFVFAFPIRNCQDCPDLGSGFVAYEFSKDGRFHGAKLLKVEGNTSAPSTTVSIHGEVKRDNKFEAPAENNLTFRLEPFAEGWSLTLKDKSGHDYCAIVTPPFKGPNDLVIRGLDFKDEAVAKKVRTIRCVNSEEDYHKASVALSGYVWTEMKQASQTARAKRQHEKLINHARQARLTITDIQLGLPLKENVIPIEWMKFDFEFLP